MVRAGMIPNFSVALYDIKNDNTIFGPEIPSLKRVMVRPKPKTMVLNYITILKDIPQLHKTVAVVSDILINISRHVKFTMFQ